MKKRHKKILIILSTLIALSAQAEQTCKDGITATTPTSRFTINSDNTVTDNATGLTWMRCSLGQTGNDCSGGSATEYTWAEALNEVANNHSGWRLPNIKELASIVELKCYVPAINADVFPSTQSSHYWSSSPYASDDNNAWVVDFYDGSDSNYGKGNDYYVRLVRGGQ